MDRRKFLGVAATAALAAAGDVLDAKTPSLAKEKKSEGLKVKFLGSGAAGGIKTGRRHSSILVEDSFLIDLTTDSLDMIPEGVHPDTIFYTHSHSDHYEPAAALEAGIVKVYVNHTWRDIAEAEFKAACKQTGKPMPTIIPTCIGAPVEVAGVTVTPLPANHATEHILEQAAIYLLEKDGVRLLYATDTSGLTHVATRMIGIDAHKKPGIPITALIMESTMGVGHENDFRMFAHSSVDLVSRTVNVLIETNRYNPPADQPVWITHMSTSLHPENEKLPAPLRAAYDGLEVIFKKS